MRILFLLFVFSVGLLPLNAQQVKLTGQISIHNSRYRTGQIEYVSNASVQAPFAGETSSDSEGLFRLAFQGIEEGETIRLSVEKAGLEIVNRQELNEVILGRLQPLQIYLAPKGRLAEAQAELYNISKSALLQRHNEQIALLRQANAQSDTLIQDIENKLNTEIANRYEAEELLNKQLADTQRRLPAMALKLASVNLDFVSDMYRDAYEYLLEGEIELAIETLDEAVLDEEAKEIVERVQISRIGLDSLELAKTLNLDALDRLIHSLVLEARILGQKGRYLAATDTYQEALQYLKYLHLKQDNTSFQDMYTAALLALINKKEIIACVLFERAIAAGPLPLQLNEQAYFYDEATAKHYIRLVRKLGSSNK